MTAISHSQPAPSASHLRAYLAGTGATGALIAGVVVVFLSVAAFVAFKGAPFGGAGDDTGNLSLGANAAPPESAAATLAAAPRAVAAAPVRGAPVGLASTAGGAGGFINGPNGRIPLGNPGGNGNPPVAPPVIPGIPAPGDPGGSNALTGTVQALDQTTGQLGLDTNLSGATGPLTRQLDQTVNGTLNNVGGVVGKPHLGDQVGQTVNGLTGGLLGGGK